MTLPLGIPLLRLMADRPTAYASLVRAYRTHVPFAFFDDSLRIHQVVAIKHVTPGGGITAHTC